MLPELSTATPVGRLNSPLSIPDEPNSKRRVPSALNFIRLFPAANLESHFSYNCDPLAAWNKGVQVVSCNIQNIDENLKKHFKKFKKYSFVLKPVILRKTIKIEKQS